MIARTMPARMSFNYKVENDNYMILFYVQHYSEGA